MNISIFTNTPRHESTCFVGQGLLEFGGEISRSFHLFPVTGRAKNRKTSGSGDRFTLTRSIDVND